MNVVGRYRLVRLIKRGGVAEVHEVHLDGECGFTRRFALKRPSPGADLAELTAFADEALILSHLEHPGIISILELSSHQGWPFQILEYVDGYDLSELCECAEETGIRIEPPYALRMIADAAFALDYAHKAVDATGRPLNIVHRDVSPGNILVSSQGQVKLIDFGVALATGRMTRTLQGVVKGHLLFMAPERTTHETVDPRTDVFSLGCVLHYMLAGTSPVVAFRKSRDSHAIRISHTLDADIAEIVEKAVWQSPADRFASAIDFAAACTDAIRRRGGLDRQDLSRWLRMLATRAEAASMNAPVRQLSWPSVDVRASTEVPKPPTDPRTPSEATEASPKFSTVDPAMSGAQAAHALAELETGTPKPSDTHEVAGLETVMGDLSADEAMPVRPKTRFENDLDPHEEQTLMLQDTSEEPSLIETGPPTAALERRTKAVDASETAHPSDAPKLVRPRAKPADRLEAAHPADAPKPVRPRGHRRPPPK